MAEQIHVGEYGETTDAAMNGVGVIWEQLSQQIKDRRH